MIDNTSFSIERKQNFDFIQEYLIWKSEYTNTSMKMFLKVYFNF
jgi:hypothetical protein